METRLSPKLLEEEEIVAELSALGITYLSRLTGVESPTPRPGPKLLADIIRQPSSRVRTAVIALLLVHPAYSQDVPAALKKLHSKDRLILKFFYTAAVYLQKRYANDLYGDQVKQIQWLPDFFGEEIQVPASATPLQALKTLGHRHQILTHSNVNWTGTYLNVLKKLLKRSKFENERRNLCLLPNSS